jgi:hypothetical protein
MVSVPTRLAVPALAATEYATDPAPLPLEPDVIVIQETLLAAVHEHPDGVETPTVPAVAFSETDALAGEIDVVQGAPCCVTVTVCPAIVTVPVREALLAFAVIASETVPFPDPVEPPVMVIQDAELEAVHAQPEPAVTSTVPVDAGDSTERLVVESVKAHTGAACVTVNVRPPTVIVAVRAAAVVFASALYAMVASPLPLVAPVMVSHVALLDAVHAHPLAVSMENDPLAAAASSETLEGDRV